MTTFVFDGSFDGLLSAIFDVYELKAGNVRLVSADRFQPGFLIDSHEVVTDDAKAKRVWTGLKKKLDIGWRDRFYKSFLAETEEAFQHLLDFARYIFDNPPGAENNYGHPSVIALSQFERSVSRERHRMKAFIRFEQTIDGIFYAPIEPDFNVLPLVVKFFKDRYADQRWIIYDRKRRYGMYYDLEKVEAVTFEFVSEVQSASPYLPLQAIDEKENLYSVLWNDYFKSTNIPARRNMKLHLQHVPKRYWKYLTEKKGS